LPLSHNILASGFDLPGAQESWIRRDSPGDDSSQSEIALASPNDDPPERRWVVAFKYFRTRDEAQRRVIDELRGTAIEVVKVWLKVLTPDAVVVEPSDQSVRRIAFRYRSQMRRFLRTFGGRQLPPSTDGARQ